ncbi:hypothetical protein [Streptomyces sp. SP18CS02]|uniref:hypothetical protein n=1 Tax=Streptomyces sp. SP18CS02 TaxID=3002531 RepID=UPI002E78758B|nr:hypothetical protein [Streptomyces sp. SP18CS02]MEE1757128.1 hypothetical protein [Streptomyces sp. SP18CS02]
MRGDETQSATAGDDATLARRGPRHAAPRKSLLTKLQAPAGKAIALAAMPTAVLVGLGLTPRLALADEKDIPYAPGPCVTRSDEPSESAEPSASDSPKPSTSASAPAGRGGGDDAENTENTENAENADKEPAPGASPSASGTAGRQAAQPKAPATTSPAATPTPTGTRNPLDPLGVGDALKDLFDGPDDEPTATPSTSAPAPAQPSTKPPAQPSAKPSARPSTKPADDEADRTKDAIKDAAERVGAKVEELPEDVKGLDPKKDEDIPDGAKPNFPCPTPDPQALADAKLEPGLPLLPDEPWKLESSRLTLRGLDYHGIVEVQTGSGKVKKVLKFTASSVDIVNLHQLTVHSEGRTGHVASRPGSTSTITGGTVTMYTEELKGNLFGIIPITFSPETPPPVNVSYAFFTNVKVTQAGQFGGDLTVPGLHNYIEG